MSRRGILAGGNWIIDASRRLIRTIRAIRKPARMNRRRWTT
jgi:hypothetical protein